MNLATRHLQIAHKRGIMPSGLPYTTWWGLKRNDYKTKTTWQIVFNYKDKEGKVFGGALTVGTLQDFPHEHEAKAVAEFVMQEAMGIGISERAKIAKKNANHRAAKFTTDWYRDRLTAQAGKCAICGREPKRLVVDHDHDDGELRGLLCGNCNTGIGMMNDDVVLLRKAVSYLEEHGQ